MQRSLAEVLVYSANTHVLSQPMHASISLQQGGLYSLTVNTELASFTFSHVSLHQCNRSRRCTDRESPSNRARMYTVTAAKNYNCSWKKKRRLQHKILTAIPFLQPTVRGLQSAIPCQVTPEHQLSTEPKKTQWMRQNDCEGKNERGERENTSVSDVARYYENAEARKSLRAFRESTRHSLSFQRLHL